MQMEPPIQAGTSSSHFCPKVRPTSTVSAPCDICEATSAISAAAVQTAKSWGLTSALSEARASLPHNEAALS